MAVYLVVWVVCFLSPVWWFALRDAGNRAAIERRKSRPH
jgi:hypothetical protein